MEKTGICGKTPKGLEEIGTRALKLPPKLRQLLIMVDIEESTSREALRDPCEYCRTIIAGVLGKARAEKFRTQAETLLD